MDTMQQTLYRYDVVPMGLDAQVGATSYPIDGVRPARLEPHTLILMKSPEEKMQQDTV